MRTSTFIGFLALMPISAGCQKTSLLNSARAATTMAQIPEISVSDMVGIWRDTLSTDFRSQAQALEFLAAQPLSRMLGQLREAADNEPVKIGGTVFSGGLTILAADTAANSLIQTRYATMKGWLDASKMAMPGDISDQQLSALMSQSVQDWSSSSGNGDLGLDDPLYKVQFECGETPSAANDFLTPFFGTYGVIAGYNCWREHMGRPAAATMDAKAKFSCLLSPIALHQFFKRALKYLDNYSCEHTSTSVMTEATQNTDDQSAQCQNPDTSADPSCSAAQAKDFGG